MRVYSYILGTYHVHLVLIGISAKYASAVSDSFFSARVQFQVRMRSFIFSASKSTHTRISSLVAVGTGKSCRFFPATCEPDFNRAENPPVVQVENRPYTHRRLMGYQEPPVNRLLPQAVATCGYSSCHRRYQVRV